MDEVKRTMKNMPYTGFKPNSPNDFIDYSISYYLPETIEKIEKALENFYEVIHG